MYTFAPIKPLCLVYEDFYLAILNTFYESILFKGGRIYFLQKNAHEYNQSERDPNSVFKFSQASISLTHGPTAYRSCTRWYIMVIIKSYETICG
jgi:hypothetical protein